MESGKAVAGADAIGIKVSGEVWIRGVGGTLRKVAIDAAGGVVRGAIFIKGDVGANDSAGGWIDVGVIGGILDGNERVERVICAPQPDEEELFAVETDIAFGEGAFDDQGNVYQGGKGDTQADF